MRSKIVIPLPTVSEARNGVVGAMEGHGTTGARCSGFNPYGPSENENVEADGRHRPSRHGEPIVHPRIGLGRRTVLITTPVTWSSSLYPRTASSEAVRLA